MADSQATDLLGEVFDAHPDAEFDRPDLDAAMATMADDPYLVHVYWDQASLLVQVGLLDPAGLPVTGAEQADNLLSPRTMRLNALLGEGWQHRS
jgi:carboxymethylenebutenolidase